jgi:hypothetical protein
MPTEPRAIDLMRDHAAIESLSARLLALLDGDATPAALALALDHLVATVSDHLSVEDAMIYTLAMRAQPGVAEESVTRARDEFDRLKANWNDYLVEWTAESIAADRPAFDRATRAMLPRLRDRVKLENELLFAVSIQPPAPR